MTASAFTPARTKAILVMLADGVFIETACQAAGVNPRTYRRWLERADDPAADPKYATFRDAALTARAKAESDAIRIIVAAGKTDARHLEWFLERSFPTRYGRQTKTELTGKDGASLISLPDLHRLGGAEGLERFTRLMGITDDETETD